MRYSVDVLYCVMGVTMTEVSTDVSGVVAGLWGTRVSEVTMEDSGVGARDSTEGTGVPEPAAGAEEVSGQIVVVSGMVTRVVPPLESTWEVVL